MNIGFIGLGNMGAPMAINLAEAGHKLTGFDTSKDAVDKVADKIPIAPSLSSTVENKEIVITMLPDGEALVKVAEEILPIEKIHVSLTVQQSTSARQKWSQKWLTNKDFLDWMHQYLEV